MKGRDALLWIALAVAAVTGYVMLGPGASPFGPRDWQITEAEARAIALERFNDLGEPVDNPYVVTVLGASQRLERRLNLEAKRLGEEALRDGPVGEQILYWEVWVYDRERHAHHWTYRAEIGLQGQILALVMRLQDDEGSGVKDGSQARTEAEAFLREQGFEMSSFLEPEERKQQLATRTDLELRYRYRELQLGERFPYGIAVGFAGEELTGYRFWLEDPDEDALRAELQPFSFLELGKTVAIVLLLPLVAIPFVRRYHAGEIGVQRGVQIGGLLLVLGLALMALTGVDVAQGSSTGIATRPQMTWLTSSFMFGFVFLPIALMSVLTWSVGESLARERYPGKLAAFDALFQGQWSNATVARSSLRGLALGAVISCVLALVGLVLKEMGVRGVISFLFGAWWYSSNWPGVVIIIFFGLWMLHAELFGRLFLISFASKWVGVAAAMVLSIPASVFLLHGPGLPLVSVFWYLVAAAIGHGLLALIFVRFDLLTSLTAGLSSAFLAFSLPLLQASDPWLQLQGGLPILFVAIPALVGLRNLTSSREFRYRWDDVPPHVRRIAERERQKVELETARNIQSSILPDLPPAVNGVQISHAYLPASEVGGDFYDVLALEDGRLAVAVGDVAGHGVSSGLVMSMAKSALAVQVTFRPEVEEVFTTLNRMIYQSARKRLLTTLCYALIDPKQREILYASAGHLFPYRITTDGSVHALESVSYPLGVRDQLDVSVRSARLEAGDQLFMFSDGVVEAHGDQSDELFGFERLEQSLKAHARRGVEGIRDGVLGDIARFTSGAPREDDLTVLVLELP